MTKHLNPSKSGRAILLAVAGAWSVGFAPSAEAVPPAPYHLIYGMARDQYGTPLTGPSSFVTFQSQSGVKLTGQIIPALAAGVNYQIKVPMDSGQSAQLYRPDAQLTSNAFTMLVVVGTVTNLPLEMAGGSESLGQPGGATRINLTLGVDSNGDGIPDAWENAYLAALGTNVSLSALNASSRLAGGLTLEQAYLLGLPVFNPGTTFQVTLLGFSGNSPILAFPGMTGRSYTVLGSSDLTNWTQLSINLPSDAPGAPTQSFYYSSVMQNVTLRVNLPGPASTSMFLKVLLQ